MGIRNILILFFSAMAVSLVILIIFFSLFFENMDFSFNTRVPESAPVLDEVAKEPLDAPMAGTAQEDDPMVGVVGDPSLSGRRAVVNVPGESVRPTVPAEKSRAVEEPESTEPHDEATAPEIDNGQGDVNTDDRDVVGIDESSPPDSEATPQKPVKAPEQRPPSAAPLPVVPLPTPPAPKPALPAPAASQPSGGGMYRVYVAGFSSAQEAQEAAGRYASLGLNPVVRSNGGRVTLQLGVFSNESYAQGLAQRTGAAVEKF